MSSIRVLSVIVLQPFSSKNSYHKSATKFPNTTKNEMILQHHVDKLRKTFDSGNCTVC